MTDGVADGSTTLTSATANFGTDVVGNIVYVFGGTGSITAGRYQIVTRTSATAIVVDRSTGLTAGTGVTLNIGGAAKTIPAVMAMVASSGVQGNKFFVKAEATIVTTASITLNAPGSAGTTTAPLNRLIGYTTTRGDAGKVTVQLSTNSSLVGLNATTGAWSIENFTVDCNNLTGSTGIVIARGMVYNCKVQAFTNVGLNVGSNGLAQNNEVTSGTSAATSAIRLGTTARALYNNVHDNACVGILHTGNNQESAFNRVVNNTGATSDGIQIAGGVHTVLNNTVYGSGRHGLNNTSSQTDFHVVRNNIFAGNGASGAGYGYVGGSAAGTPAGPWVDGNAYWNNTSGTRNNIDDTTTNPINGVAAYTNVLDVVLSADPFTNKAAGDFTLNNTSGAGASLRGTATPGLLPGVAQVGYMDFGCYQSQAAAGGGFPVIGAFGPVIRGAA